jgi:hypothetical protein
MPPFEREKKRIRREDGSVFVIQCQTIFPISYIFVFFPLSILY